MTSAGDVYSAIDMNRFFDGLRNRGMLGFDSNDFVELKVKASEAFKVAISDSTHVMESYLLLLAIGQHVQERDLKHEFPAVDKAVYQHLISGPLKTRRFTKPGLSDCPDEYEQGLEERVLNRLLELEREGKL